MYEQEILQLTKHSKTKQEKEIKIPPAPNLPPSPNK